MKITRSNCDKEELIVCGQIPFGSVIGIRHTDFPANWNPAHHRIAKERGGVRNMLFQLTSGYYKDEVVEHTGLRYLQMIELETGAPYPIDGSTFVVPVHHRGYLMKISKGPCNPSKPLRGYNYGETFTFANNLASKHQADDVFMRLEVCNSYEPRNTSGRRIADDSIGVVNLRSGSLAWVSASRDAFPVKAEVCLHVD